MAIRRFFVGLAVASIFVIGIWLLGSAPQATAETLNFKSLAHVTKLERVPIADVEGHFLSVSVREGVAILENGEWAWIKASGVSDQVKGAGTTDMYATYTFQDGSTLTTRTKVMVETTPMGVPSAFKTSGEITHGTGRFEGIKGTVTSSGKFLSPEKGELMGKNFNEGTLVYTLPSK